MAKLFVVPTPVGNLEDMTYRAVRVLKEVDLILAEDTRTSSVLLNCYGIRNRLQPHHRNNEHRQAERIAERIQAGENMALVSDAGTPSVSDPGFLLVRACVRLGVEVECLPGATAFVPALVVSGLPNDRFCFEGFLPLKKGRQTRLKTLAAEERTLILYESPLRLLKTLAQLAETFGEDRPVSLSRELSKRFEETVRGTLRDVLEHFSSGGDPKGEFVIVIAGATKENKKAFDNIIM